MTPTLTEFLAWLEESPRNIPTLPDQADLQPADLIPLFDTSSEVQSGFAIEFCIDEGKIYAITGNQISFDVYVAGLTWTRFFGLLQTTAHNSALHGAILLRPHTHRLTASFKQPPQIMGASNLNGWLDCPNNRACPFLAAAIRAFVLNTLPERHPLYQWV